MSSTYADAYARSVSHPEAFWREQQGLIEWDRQPATVLDADNAPRYRWFPDGELNICRNALDRHVAAGASSRTALIYDSPLAGLPLPPGALTGVRKNEDRFRRSCLDRFPGYYDSEDGGHRDEDGYLFVMSRLDDVINVAGHRLSTGAIEAILAAHPAVAECAVIGLVDELKGQVPCGLVVLKSSATIGSVQLRNELTAAVRESLGAVAAFRDVSIVRALPKTRSGKIVRGCMRDMAAGRTVAIPSTIEDATVIEELRPLLTGPTRG